MAIAAVRAYLSAYGLDAQIREFEVSSATVELAAAARDCQPCRIAKTMSFRVDEGCVLVVTAGDAKIDNPKYKAQFHTKAVMLPPEDVERLTGHAVGGVCPFGVPKAAAVYLDVSLRRFDTVFPACGSANSAIELTPKQLETLSASKGWVDVCKGWQGADA